MIESVSRELYDDLYRQIEEEIRHGDYRHALKLSRRALSVANQLGDQDLVHRSISNRSVIYLELGHPKRAERGLREIILSSAEPTIVCAAAYNLAISLRRQKRIERATLFAQKALEQAKAIKHSVWLSRSHNLLGNIKLSQSDMDGALRCYRKSLEIRLKMDGDTRFSRTILLDNIGYCWLLKKRYRKGVELVEQARILAEEIDSVRYISECSQDLCFGYMKLNELDKAASYGKRALEIAESQRYADIARNCYYLLGEVYSLAGEDDTSSVYLDKLQALYPHLPFLREFLSTFDVSDIIALKNP